MTYDTKVPPQLKSAQQWFGSIIGRPIDNDSQMIPLSPEGRPMEEEAAEYISPSPTLRPAQRIQLYNQQYWWRLLNTFHESFPTVARLFGHYGCNNEIAFPYFVKYPPRHWSLAMVGDRIAQWIEEEYHAGDKALVLDAAKVDWAFNYSFIAPQMPAISPQQLPNEAEMSRLLSKKLYLQPSLHLFEMDCDMFQFRVELLKHEVEHWLENDFPELKHGPMRYFYLYRTPKNDIAWNEMCQGEYHLLNLFHKGCSIEKACRWIEKQQGPIFQEAQEKLHLWFQSWTMRGWLSLG